MLMLDDMRAAFARKLADDPAARFSMDKALAHVITVAYERGMADGMAAAKAGAGIMGDKADTLERT